MRLSLTRLVLFGAALSMLGCGGGGGGSSSGTYGGGSSPGSTPPAYHVWVDKSGSMAYQPANIHVKPGDTVTWDFFAAHTVTSDTGSSETYDSGLLSTGTFTHTFPTVGVYTYHCTIHGTSMSGTVTVVSGSGGNGY